MSDDVKALKDMIADLQRAVLSQREVIAKLREQIARDNAAIESDVVDHWKREYEIQRGIIIEMLTGKARAA